jgi:hypothetical protein
LFVGGDVEFLSVLPVLCFWGPAIIAAIAFARTYPKPRSRKRFERLCGSGWVALWLTLFGIFPLLELLPTGLDEDAFDDVWPVAYIAFGAATVVFLVWMYFALRKYPEFAAPQPDFAEDGAENPLRADPRIVAPEPEA